MRSALCGEASSKREVLFAVLGMSPAIITETIWALAHQKKPIIPHHVCIVTTVDGKQCLEKTLFDDGGWERLRRTLGDEGHAITDRLHFGCNADDIQLLPAADRKNNLRDITTSEDSMATADFIMRKLRQYTEDPDTRILASIAGGRKTMSALLTSCMILLGREQDRLLHVLVNPPYDNPKLNPLFLYPENGTIHHLPDRKESFPSCNAHIELTEIPFVRARGWYEKEYKTVPPSYAQLVSRFAKISPNTDPLPPATFHARTGKLEIRKMDITLSDTEKAMLYMLLKSIKEGTDIQVWKDIVNLFDTGETVRKHSQIAWIKNTFGSNANYTHEDIKRAISRIRNKVARITGDNTAEKLLPPMREIRRQKKPLIRFRDL